MNNIKMKQHIPHGGGRAVYYSPSVKQ